MSFYKLLFAATLLAVFSALTSCSSCSEEEKSIVGNSENRYIAVKEKGENLWSILDYKTGKIIRKAEFRDDQNPTIIQGEVFFIKDTEGYNYYNIKDLNNPLNDTPFLYATIFDNKSKHAIVVTQEGKMCIINKEGNEEFNLPDEIRTASRFVNGYSIVSDNDERKGVINSSGDYIIRPKYDEISSPSADGCVVATIEQYNNQDEYEELNKKFVAIKLKEKGYEELFTFSSSQYEEYGIFCNGYLPVLKDDDIVLLDNKGTEVSRIGRLSYDTDEEDLFSISLLRVIDNKVQTYKGGYYGLKDIKTGKTLIRNKYKFLIPIGTNRFIAMRADGKFGVINSDDEPINNNFDKTMITPIPESETLLVLEKVTSDDYEDNDYSDTSYKIYFTDIDLKCQKDTTYIDDLSLYPGENQLSNLFFDINKSANFIMAKINPQSFMGFNKDVKRSTISDLWTVDNTWDKEFNSADGITTIEHRKYTRRQGDYNYTLLFSDMESSDVERVSFGVKYGIISFNVGSKKLGIERELVNKLDREISKKGFTYTDEIGAYVNNYTNSSVSLNYCSNGDFHVIYDFDMLKFSSIDINEIYDGDERVEIIKDIDLYNQEHNTGKYLPDDNSEYMTIIDHNKDGGSSSNNSSLSGTLSEDRNSRYSFGSVVAGIATLYLLGKLLF